MEDKVKKFAETYPEEIRELILLTRALILSVFPQAVEQVDEPSKLVAYGTGVRYADMICTIMPYRAHVNLGLYRAVDLPDPDGLLEGTGKLHRHVKINSRSDLERPALHELLSEAVRAKTG